MADFLLEIGLEEVPARMIAAAQAELTQRVVGLLERERLVPSGAEAKSYATPRRLAVMVRGLAERQEDAADEVLGPAMKIAFKDGIPGPAAVAFAKKAGVGIAALRVVATAKGDYVAATAVTPGRSAREVLAAELPKQLAGIYWAKNMYWRAGRPERFVRPVRWLMALLGDAVVPVEFGGCTAGRETFGHRVLFGPAAIRVESPESYEAVLTNAFVMADVELRRHTIRKSLDRVCRTAGQGGLRWREDHALVDKMTHLTEWPSVIAGAFDAEYLRLPQEVLVTVMRDHQSYFAVEDAAGELTPHFLTMLNTVADPAGEEVIRHGNERVLRARFNDARFFWEFDQRVLLKDRTALLEKVTFQKDLGSYAAKSERVRELARRLGDLAYERGLEVDRNALRDAAELAKTDLTTELVKEFPELQGQIGGLYGRAQAFSAAACDAIYDHYRPVSMEDRIPRTIEGQLLALADKADTIASMFGLGMEPTGSRDPFALRRAANGIVKILAEGSLDLSLTHVLRSCQVTSELAVKLNNFFWERISYYLRESKGFTYDIVGSLVNNHLVRSNSFVGLQPYDVVAGLVRRAEAISKVRGTANFLAVCRAYKRAKNLYSHASDSNEVFDLVPIFNTLEEANIWGSVQSVGEKYVADCRVGNYADALNKLALLGPVIDQYFESVLVNVDDEELRAKRLGFVRFLVVTFAQIADFSEIVTAG